MNKPTFEKPIKIADAKIVFSSDVMSMMPAYNDIPEQFKRLNNPYVKWQNKWFFRGLSDGDIPRPKPGIDFEDAIRHLSAIQRSFCPKHEHKEAAVAYLASLWLETPNV